MSLDSQLHQAVTVLKNRGVIAYPTESVYGLGCDPDDAKAVEKILELKKRPREKGLIVIAADFSQLEKYLLPIDEEIRQRVFATWPGPFTWLWPVKETVSPLVRGQHKTLAVRVSAHPLVKQLCEDFGKAMISTSANPADQPPARTADEVRSYFDDKLDFILDAPVGLSAQPTEIRDVLTNQVIRPS